MPIKDKEEKREYHRTADPDKRYTHWAPVEIDILRRMWRQGRTRIEIARLLGRSYTLVREVVKSLDAESRTR